MAEMSGIVAFFENVHRTRVRFNRLILSSYGGRSDIPPKKKARRNIHPDALASFREGQCPTLPRSSYLVTVVSAGGGGGGVVTGSC